MNEKIEKTKNKKEKNEKKSLISGVGSILRGEI